MNSQVLESKSEDVDPAPPAETNDYAALRSTLLNEGEDMFTRYRSLFKLKKLASDISVEIVSHAAFATKDPLLRHECAYVLGQLQGIKSIPALVKILEVDPEPIVRHEAAEALGNMWEESKEVILILDRFAKEDKAAIVRTSCEVALANIRFRMHESS